MVIWVFELVVQDKVSLCSNRCPGSHITVCNKIENPRWTWWLPHILEFELQNEILSPQILKTKMSIIWEVRKHIGDICIGQYSPFRREPLKGVGTIPQSQHSGSRDRWVLREMLKLNSQVPVLHPAIVCLPSLWLHSSEFPLPPRQPQATTVHPALSHHTSVETKL